MKRIILLFLFLSFSVFLFAQGNQELPQLFLSTSYNAFTQSNEIKEFENIKLNANTYLRKNTGMLSDVYQAQIKAGIKYKKSSIGIFALTDRQGDLIKRNRIYANYNLHIKLSKELYSFAGFSAGMVNKVLGNNLTTTRGSASVWDASVRTGIYNTKFIVTASIEQIPQKLLTPINFSVPMLRFYKIYGLYSLSMSKSINLDFVAWGNIYTDIKNEYITGLQLAIKNDYKCGLVYSSWHMVNCFVDFNVVKKEAYTVSFLLSYETNLSINKAITGVYSIINTGIIFKRVK